MQKSTLKKFFSGLIGTAVIASAFPAVIPSAPISAEESGRIIYSSDFEDGDVSAFTNRGTNDTTVIGDSTENAVSGTHSLCASGRTSSWNGPAFRLDDKCEPFTEYYISAKVKGRYYTNATLSFQYSDTSGEPHYSNLVQNLNGSDWQTVENVKVSFTDDMTDVYVYFEGGSDDIFIDDFSVVEVPAIQIEEDIPSLKTVYSNYFKIGTAITPAALSSKPTMSLVDKHFSGSITLGNEMKPDSVIDKNATLKYVEETGDDTNPQVSFSAAKSVLDYCQKNNIPVRVHTLVWHSQTPDWFFKENYDASGEWVSSEKMIKRMENYIKNYFETLTQLYPDVDFYACDVVNEAWTDNGTPRDPGEQGSSGSSKSAWVQVFGDNSFIEYAFTFARKYAPSNCKLYYNDYNEYMQNKTTAIVNMANDLKEKGLIDGIGMQSHLDARSGSDAFPSISAYEKAVKAFTETGLDVQVTELDATIPGNTDANYEVQASYYSNIMDILVKYSDGISAVVFWGINDDGSWRASQYPLLFNAEYKAKPCFYSIVDGIEVPTETTTEADDDIIYGDADLSGGVTIDDVILILCHASDKDSYPLSDEALNAADVYQRGDGISVNDAVSVQKLLTLQLDSLPESYAE